MERLRTDIEEFNKHFFPRTGVRARLDKDSIAEGSLWVFVEEVSSAPRPAVATDAPDRFTELEKISVVWEGTTIKANHTVSLTFTIVADDEKPFLGPVQKRLSVDQVAELILKERLLSILSHKARSV